MSPLLVNVASADVIIHELVQPHRYEFALNCKCGFQSHGFAAHKSRGEDEADMKATAFAHLSQKHQIGANEVEKYVHVMATKTMGGFGYDQLLPLWQAEQHRKTIQAPKPPTVATQVAELKKSVVPAPAPISATLHPLLPVVKDPPPVAPSTPNPNPIAQYSPTPHPTVEKK